MSHTIIAQANNLGPLLAGLVVGVVVGGIIGGLIGAVLIRAAIALTNKVYGRGVLEPHTFGVAFVTALIASALNFALGFVLGFMAAILAPDFVASPAGDVTLRIVSLVISLAVLTVLLQKRHAGHEGASLGEAALCTVFYLLIGIAIAATIVGLMFALSGAA